MKSTRRWQQLLLNSLAIILGNALYSLAVALFLEPAGLITGGATGIALAFGRLTGLSVSGFLFLFNMSMLEVRTEHPCQQRAEPRLSRAV